MCEKDTVQISRESLETLVEEAEFTVNSIDDPEWNSDEPEKAIEEARSVLN